MPSNGSSRDVDALMRGVAPVIDAPSPEALDAALERVLAEAALTEHGADARTSSTRLRVTLGMAVVAAAVAAAFAVINLLPSPGAPAGLGKAWARDVAARSAAVAAGGGNGTLHIDVLVTQTAQGTAPVRYRVESWSQLRAPHAYWETIRSGSDVTTTTVLHDGVMSYDSRTKTLSVATKKIGAASSGATLFDPAYHAVLTVLHPRDAASPGPAGHLPPTLSRLIARLLRSPNVTVDSNSRIDGRPAIRITALHGRALLYVEPRTYTPIVFLTHGDPGATGSVAISMRFAAYETLPRGSVAPPDLRRLHPHAKS